MRSLHELKQLLSPQGKEALLEAEKLNPNEENFLQCYQKLSKKISPSLARTALETIIIRQKAIQSNKFILPEKMLFTAQAYEQASQHLISQHRAQRYQNCSQIIDVCCSIGCDSITLAQYGEVIGIDLDLIRLCIAEYNCTIWGAYKALIVKHLPIFIQADVRNQLPIKLNSHYGIFFDPSRRNNSGRVKSIEDYQPPLKIIHHWLPITQRIGVKLSPAIDYQDLLPYLENGAEVEFISIHKELKEAVLWLNEFSTTVRRATLLPDGYTLEENFPSPKLPLSKPLDYLYEPDPAIIRAQLIAKLGWNIEGFQLDKDIAYLTSHKFVSTPFAQIWKIEDWFPFQLKRLRAYLRKRNIGSIVVKKRGSPWQPETLIKALKLNGSDSCTLFLTHSEGKPIVIIAQPIL